MIVTLEKPGFAEHLTCFVCLDQKLPAFFDPNLGFSGPDHVLMILDYISRAALVADNHYILLNTRIIICLYRKSHVTLWLCGSL